jgi:quercetin dioxygenase-like cupin family protein
MKNYPVTIDNGHGEVLTFVKPYTENGIEYMQIENSVGPKSGPPMHVHHLQNEEITIVEGVMATQILGEEPQYYIAGETVMFKAGVPHKFWNAGDTVLKGTGRIWPVYNIEYFLTELFKSTKAGNSARPSVLDMAFLLRKYKAEFDVYEIPPFVKKTVLPLMYFIGKCTGAHRKYRNAP